MNDEKRSTRGTSFVVGLAATATLAAVLLALGPGGTQPETFDARRPETYEASRPEVLRRPDRLMTSQRIASRADQRCMASLLTVESSGLHLNDSTEFRCPGDTGEYPGDDQHWGATCWQNELCPGRSYIAVTTSLIGPDDGRLRYVIAHEICHVNSYMRTGEAGSEAAADACAAGAGFPRR